MEFKSPQQLNISGNNRKRIGILIVAYNHANTLLLVLNRIPSKVWKEIEEVAVFDDASSDDTYSIGLDYKNLSGNDKITIFRNQKNLGYGGNQKRGYQYFSDKNFDIVVLLHGDGQYAPEFLANLYNPIVSGKADAIFGSRMMNDFGGALKGGMPIYKYIGNKILTFFENYTLKMKLTEFHSGYRAYNLHALRNINMTNMTNDFHFDTEIIIKLNFQGYCIKEVPIPTFYGNEICYVNGMKYAFNIYKSLIHFILTIKGINCYHEFEEYFPQI